MYSVYESSKGFTKFKGKMKERERESLLARWILASITSVTSSEVNGLCHHEVVTLITERGMRGLKNYFDRKRSYDDLRCSL